MSMNLHCDQLDLLQTPTWLTYACLMRPDGKIDSHPESIEGMKRALYIYLEWAGDLGLKVARTDEECKQMDLDRENFNYHKQAVIALMDDPKLRVCMI